MAMVEITDPIILDATGQDIVSKLDEVKQAIQPTNPCLDIDISLNASGWSSSSPYTYTYTNAHITSGCLVQCDFLATSNGDAVLHLDYEKVTNGVEFYAPTKPTKNIPVRIHVQNADATSTSATTADAVSTDAVSGASNVQDALSTLNGNVANKSSATITPTNVTLDNNSICQKVGRLVILQLSFKPTQEISSWTTFAQLPSGYRPTETMFGRDFSLGSYQINTDGTIQAAFTMENNTQRRMVPVCYFANL